MQIYDVNDYYRRKRFPWVPVLGLGIIVILGGCYLHSRKPSKKPAPDALSTETNVPTSAEEVSVETPLENQQTTHISQSTEPVIENVLSKGEADALMTSAQSLQKEGKLEAARDLLLGNLNRVIPTVRTEFERLIGEINVPLMVSTRPAKGKAIYAIQSGDSLSKIAAKYNCPVPLIQKANRITDPARIRIGNQLVLLDNPEFSILVSKTENTLTLLLNEQFFKKYAVGTGMFAKTPVGTFRISDKVESPPWWPGDGRAAIPFGSPENILGTHWLALQATGDTPKLSGYGIHGTWDENSIGKQSSAGCVRMRNTDVAEVFMFVPRNTPVTIVE